AEGADDAGFAEEMVNLLLAELVVTEGVRPREELEGRGGGEAEDGSRPRADGAVAADDLVEIETGPIPHRPAVARSLVAFGFLFHPSLLESKPLGERVPPPMAGRVYANPRSGGRRSASARLRGGSPAGNPGFPGGPGR